MQEKLDFQSNAVNTPLKAKKDTKVVETTPRKKLGDVQPSASNNQVMVPAGLSSLPQSISKNMDCERIIEMLSEESPNSYYWEKMAEERRLALVDACEENEQLHKTHKILLRRIKELENQVSSLLEYKILYKVLSNSPKPDSPS